MKSTGYPLHSHVSPSLPLPCVTVCHQVSTELYNPDAGFVYTQVCIKTHTVGLASVVDNMVFFSIQTKELRRISECKDVNFNTKVSCPGDTLSVLTIVQVSHFLDSDNVIFGT